LENHFGEYCFKIRKQEDNEFRVKLVQGIDRHLFLLDSVERHDNIPSEIQFDKISLDHQDIDLFLPFEKD